jgi:GntR family transcriptional regulator
VIYCYISLVQIAVNASDELPIYRQIMRQITEAIAGARLGPGDKLPSHRELSEQIVVAPLTVKKAYDELEAMGFIETQRGRGTFVRASLPPADHGEQMDRIRQEARRLLSQAYLAGLRFAEVTEILEDADRELTRGPQPEKERP